MIARFARGARVRLWARAFCFAALLLSPGVPAFAQYFKETRVSFAPANASRNGYELAGLDVIYLAEACAGEIHVGYGVEPGSIDVASGYWYEGHRYPIRSAWPGPRIQSFSVQMNAKHGARTFREWTVRDLMTTNKLDCDTAPQFFFVAGGWKALLGDQANDRDARENALASISLNTPFEADRTLRNPEIESLIRREIEQADAARRADEEKRAEAARQADEARKAEEARQAEAARQAEVERLADASRVADGPSRAQASSASDASAQTSREAREREEAQRRQAEAEAQERHARELERQRIEAERRREEERQAAVEDLGNTLEQGFLAGIAITGYTALPAVEVEGVSREYGLRFGQIGETGGFLFGFGTNDLSFLSGGESATNQMAMTVGGEIGLAPASLGGLSKAFMPYLGTYYKSVEFYEDLAYDQEEESWDTWGFNIGFMGVLGDFLVYQAGMMGDLGTPEVNYMRGYDGGFFLSLGMQMSH